MPDDYYSMTLEDYQFKHFGQSSLPKRLYTNRKWFTFATKVKARDQYACLKCGRGLDKGVILQVHHTQYLAQRKPWEYPLSDCITLCKGCHASEHKIIEPSAGWSLLYINDLGEGALGSTCQRRNCQTPIRFEFLIHHPGWGFMIVGSTCIEYLHKEDQILGKKCLDLYKLISKFVHSAWSTEAHWLDWTGDTHCTIQKDFRKLHKVKVSGNSDTWSVTATQNKRSGKKVYQVDEISKKYTGKTLDEAKELGYILLRMLLAKKPTKKERFQRLYNELTEGTQ